MLRMQWVFVLLSLVPWPACAGDVPMNTAPPSSAHTIRVGPNQAIQRIAEAMSLAKDGDVIEIDAGTYLGDVGSWRQSNLTIRAVHGRARVVQLGDSAEGKALWVVKGDNVLIENIEFSGGIAPAQNAAGIRHEGGKLTIRNCLFESNQMGLLTWNDERSELVVEKSEFRDNRVAATHQAGDPIGHQIYVGTIGRFTLRESYIHHGAFGHLVKSRARENHIVNNRITDEIGGRSSYELEFPNGGMAYVIGNIVEQSAQTENRTMISFGAEGYRWARNELYLGNNTLIDDSPRGGDFVRVRDSADRVRLVNNVFRGKRALDSAASWELAGNAYAADADMPFASLMDYRLAQYSALVGAGVDLGQPNAVPLRLEREYVHPMQSRPVPAGRQSPGALQSVVR